MSLKKKISFWVSQIMATFSQPNSTAEREVMLYLERKKKEAYFVFIVRPFSFLETSFLSNNMNTFNLRKYIYVFPPEK